MRVLAVLALAAVLVGSGCLKLPSALSPSQSPSAEGGLYGSVSAARVPPPDKDLSHAIVSDHGAPYMHAIQALHTGSYRMKLVGYNPLTGATDGDNPLAANSAYIAVTIHGTLACVSHFAGSGGVGGATIVNISNPAKPLVVSSIVSGAIGSRCQFTDDGKFLLLADYGGLNSGLPAPPPVADAAGYGLSVYDVKDPKNPVFLFHDAQGQDAGLDSVGGSEYHNVGTALINGTNYIFQTYTGNILALAADGKSMKLAAHVKETTHDMWVGKHPITGDWYLVTGGGRGTFFYGLNDPTHPVLASAWEAHENYTGWHRQWPVLELVEGHALMIVAGEECGNGKSLPYTVLDWSNPTAIAEMGHWQIPGKPEISEPGQLCSMNSHEFNTWNGYVATGNYHAGIWLFDVGTLERAMHPVTIGYYEPHEVAQTQGGTRNSPFAWNPDVWGAYFDARGYVFAADWMSGLYVLSFDGTPGATK